MFTERPGLTDGAALGLSKEQEKGQEELCCYSGGPRASPVKREAGVRKSLRMWDGLGGDVRICRRLTAVQGVLRSCLWVSSGLIWSSLTCALPGLGTARDSPLCGGFPCLRPKISFHKNSLQLKTKKIAHTQKNPHLLHQAWSEMFQCYSWK